MEAAHHEEQQQQTSVAHQRMSPSPAESIMMQSSSSMENPPFFGVPVVGFFQRQGQMKQSKGTMLDQSSNDSTDSAAALTAGDDERQSMLSSAPAVYYTNCFDVDETNNDDDVEKFVRHRTVTLAPPPLASNGNEKKRSAKEMWAILRDHVRERKSFHIIENWGSTRCVNNKTVRLHDVNYSQVANIPYDFTLKDCLVALLVYLAVSIIAFSFIFERWSVIDSMYFAVVTFTTIGYGDLSPQAPAGRLFCVFYALGGVAVLAIALGVVGSKIIETQVQHITKAKEEIVKEVFWLFQPTKSKEERLREFAKNNNSLSPPGSLAYLSDLDDPMLAFREDLVVAVHPWHATWEACRRFCHMLIRYGPALTPLIMGAYAIGYHEGWTWTDVVYYCTVTTTTIGYGDLTPQSESMKLFAVLFIPLSVGAMGHFLGTIANFIVEQRSQVYDKRLWNRELTLEDLAAMSTDRSGTVTELDFVVFMLRAMKKVDEDLIDKIREHFRRLDLTQSGTLERRDLELMAHKKLRSARSKLRLSTYKAKLTRKRYWSEGSDIKENGIYRN